MEWITLIFIIVVSAGYMASQIWHYKKMAKSYKKNAKLWRRMYEIEAENNSTEIFNPQSNKP